MGEGHYLRRQALLMSVKLADLDLGADVGVGNVDPRSGSTSVSPEQTTTYRLTARNRQGEVSPTPPWAGGPW